MLEQPERAIEKWRAVLQLDEADESALEALARLYEARAEWRELAWVYTQQIELATSEAVRRPLRFAMAKVYEENLGDSLEAISAYKGALEANDRDAEAVTALSRLYEREGQWADHLEALDKLAELAEQTGTTGDPSVKLELQLRAARVTEEKIQQAESAIRRYQQVLEYETPAAADVSDWMSAAQVEMSTVFNAGRMNLIQYQTEARVALERLVQQSETRDAAAAVLEPLYRKQGEWRPLSELLELKLAAEADTSERRRLLAH